MKVTNLQTETVKFLAGTTSVTPTHIGFGTGTTASTRADTALETESGGGRVAATITDGGNVCTVQGTILSTDTGLHSVSFTETASFSASSSGTMFDRFVGTGISGSVSSNVRVTKFYAYNNENVTGISFATDGLLYALIDFIDATKQPPTHTAYGTAYPIDRLESLGNWTDDSSDGTTPTLNSTNYQEGTKSLNMGKDGTSSASFHYTTTLASTVDISSADTIRFWLTFISVDDYNKLATSNCMEVRIGNDSSNYKSITFDKADMINAWRRYEITIADMSDTGSPDLSTVDYLAIYFTLTGSSETITHGNIIMDYWHAIIPFTASTNALTSEIVRQSVANPLIIGSTVEYADTLTKSSGNTYNYEYFALFDASSSGDMDYIIQTSRIRKSTTVQINTSIRVTVAFQ